MPNFSFKNFLDQHEELTYRDGLYYQKTLPVQSAFEKNYIELRKDEGRFYTDDVVVKLPAITQEHLRKKEWAIRKRSANRLIKWLTARKTKTILEVGCGNGWFLHYIQTATSADCLGVDVNETELKQANRIFGTNPKIHFAYLDIQSFSDIHTFADCILLASSFQYFADPQKLLSGLLRMLAPGGRIHIMDTNFYKDNEVESARQRSEHYFTESGYPDIKSNYHHHTWQVLKPFTYSILYNPASLSNKIIRKLRNDSPFPWIIIES